MKKIKYNEVDGVVAFTYTDTELRSDNGREQKYEKLMETDDNHRIVAVAIAVTANDFKDGYGNITQHDSLQVRPKILFRDRKNMLYYRKQNEKRYLSDSSVKKYSKQKGKLRKKVRRLYG